MVAQFSPALYLYIVVGASPPPAPLSVCVCVCVALYWAKSLLRGFSVLLHRWQPDFFGNTHMI